MLSLALRNVARHRAHSLLLAALFALAAFLFVAGNSLLAHSNRMLRELFVSTITGDLVIAADAETSMSVFGANTPAIGELIPIPVLKREGELAAALLELPAVEAATPLVSAVAVMDAGGTRSPVPVFGVEGDGYFGLLDGIEVTRGRRIAAGERGVMLTESRLSRIEHERGSELPLGSEVLLSTVQDRSFRIRAAPLVGVFRYPVSTDYVDEIAIVDAQTVRALSRIQVRAAPADGGPEDGGAPGPRNAAEVDELFGAADTPGAADNPGAADTPGAADNPGAAPGTPGAAPAAEGAGDTPGAAPAAEGAADTPGAAGGGITPEEVLDRVRGGAGDTPGPAAGTPGAAGNPEAADTPAAARAGTPGAAERNAPGAGAAGSAHFLLLRGRDTEAVRETAARFGAQVLTWRQAAGQSALLARLLQIVFNGGFALFVIAVALGATNIVLISTYRRTREIGTMRAIGTDDRRLAGIFALEHLLIAGAGWAAGVAATTGLSAVIAGREITVGNRLIAMLLGGEVLRLPVDLLSVVLCLALVMLVVAAAVLLPLSGIIRKPIIAAVRGE